MTYYFISFGAKIIFNFSTKDLTHKTDINLKKVEL